MDHMIVEPAHNSIVGADQRDPENAGAAVLQPIVPTFPRKVRGNTIIVASLAAAVTIIWIAFLCSLLAAFVRSFF
jgi:hypothetical protein